jgi:lipoprotein NlpI
MFRIAWSAILAACLMPIGDLLGDEAHPLSAAERASLNRQFEETVSRMTQQLQESPKRVDSYSARGDAYFFLGRYAEAVADYEKMVELQPALEAAHWRRGIAYFFARRYQDAARQFEIYHSHDDVDRENGIWRYFSQVKAYGTEKAQAGLLKYAKDDREPFPVLYGLFARTATPMEVFAQINAAQVSPAEREKRLFYAQLYVGLNEAVAGNRTGAVEHLRKAVRNSWAPRAAYGPRFMWHVGRLEYERLSSAEKPATESN